MSTSLRQFFAAHRQAVRIAAAAIVIVMALSGFAWWQARYDDNLSQLVELKAFTNAEYPEDPEERSRVFGNYPHRSLQIEQLDETRFRFLIEPDGNHSAAIELPEVDLAHFVAAVPPWVKSDADLVKVGLIDREWNRQQVRFRGDRRIRVEGGDGFERRALSRVDVARNCLNAGLWELLLFTDEDGVERVYEHVWFTFPLGLYKNVFEQVNGFPYWDYWWSLEHWVAPSGTPISLHRLRTVEQEWHVGVDARWDESPAIRGEQARKRKNILTAPVHSYRDWYTQPVQFSSFIPPGRYSVAHPRDTQLGYLAELTGAVVRRVRMHEQSQPLAEMELTFREPDTGRLTRLIFGGLDVTALPVGAPEHYERGWQAPMGIANPSFFEDYEHLLTVPPIERTFYGFHLDEADRWIDHHAVGVDGPLLHRDVREPTILHLYLLSYERHALLNHFVLHCPAEIFGGH